MIGGFNQQVKILGRIYHIQTELSDAGIRTEMFLGGKLVATCEKPLDAADRDGSNLASLIQEQHDKILAGVAERLRLYGERREAIPAVPAPRA